MTKRNFKTHNEGNVNCNGTSLSGYIDCDFKTLEKVFGKPTDGDGHKVTAEWEILFEDGTVCTVYNWKDSTPTSKIRDWHVGGNKGRSDVEKVLQAISKYS